MWLWIKKCYVLYCVFWMFVQRYIFRAATLLYILGKLKFAFWKFYEFLFFIWHGLFFTCIKFVILALFKNYYITIECWLLNKCNFCLLEIQYLTKTLIAAIIDGSKITIYIFVCFRTFFTILSRSKIKFAVLKNLYCHIYFFH